MLPALGRRDGNKRFPSERSGAIASRQPAEVGLDFFCPFANQVVVRAPDSACIDSTLDVSSSIRKGSLAVAGKKLIFSVALVDESTVTVLATLWRQSRYSWNCFSHATSLIGCNIHPFLKHVD